MYVHEILIKRQLFNTKVCVRTALDCVGGSDDGRKVRMLRGGYPGGAASMPFVFRKGERGTGEPEAQGKTSEAEKD